MQVQKINRVYASKTPTGCLYKVKENKVRTEKLSSKKKLAAYHNGEYNHLNIISFDETTGKLSYYEHSKEKVASIPLNVIIDNDNQININDIDKKWYINDAYDKLENFLGIGKQKTKEKENDIMATTATKKTNNIDSGTPTQAVFRSEEDIARDNAKSLYGKIFKTMQYFDTNREKFEHTDYNKGQGYSYTSAAAFKAAVRSAFLENGLVIQVAIIDFAEVETKSAKMSTLLIKGQISIIDIETGYRQVTPTMAVGADSLDKQISKAQTLMLKDYIKSNFLISDNEEIDPEADTTEVADTKGKTTKEDTSSAVDVKPKKQYKKPTEEQRSKDKEEVVANANELSDAHMKTIKSIKKMIKEVRVETGEDDFAAKTVSKLNAKDEDGNLTITPTEIKKIFSKVEAAHTDVFSNED